MSTIAVRTRLVRAFVLAVLCTAVFAPASSAAPKPVPQYPIADFLATTSMRDADFSPDGTKILVSSDKTGIFNAWAVPVAGGEPVQLTRSTTNATYGRAWYPKDERFIYTADQGGNERTHVFVQKPDGTSQDVTPGENLKADFEGWAHDQKSFFVTSNERDKRYFDLYEVDPETLKRTLVYQDSTGLSFAAISRDKRWLALEKTNGEHDSDVWLLDRQTKALRLLTKHTGTVAW
jgi:Tol biopolymer transport system component